MKDGGYTLLEVVVSLAILSFGLSVFYDGISGALGRDRINSDRSINLEIATNLIEEVGLTGPVIEGVVEGTTNDNRHWQIQVSFDPTSSEITRPRLANIIVMVGRQDKDDPAFVRLETMRILRPGEGL